MIKRCFLSRNSVCLLIGVILIVISVLKIQFHLIGCDLCIKIIAILGAILSIMGVYDLSKDGLKKDIQYPYGFDYKNEFEKFNNIGKTSNGDENKSHIINKDIKNQNEQSIRQSFGNYCEWKIYILDKYQSRINDENFYRYVKNLLRDKEYYIEIISFVATPIEIGIFTTMCALGFDKGIELIAIPVIFIFLLTLIIINFFHLRLECYFLKDFIEIVFPELSALKVSITK